MSDGYEGAVVRHQIKIRHQIKMIMAYCRDYDLDFDAELKEVRDEPQLIRMDRKYKTKDGQRVTILTVCAPSKHFPVVGYFDHNGAPVSWTSTGTVFPGGGPSMTDLLPTEE